MLTQSQENFFEIVEIEEITDHGEIINCVDLTIDEDESFLLTNGIISHNSANGSILQSRDSSLEGTYALKGKIKNCKNLSDLSENREILELMQILNLDPMVKNSSISNYRKVVIAADPDADGLHICSLIINMFYRWFPMVIKNGQLSIFKIPLVTVGDGKKRKYYYDLEDFKKEYKTGNVRYLKGLGSLSLEDWEYVMTNKILVNVSNGLRDKEYLEMAFGDSSDARKRWLSLGTL